MDEILGEIKADFSKIDEQANFQKQKVPVREG